MTRALLFALMCTSAMAQLPVARDTIAVVEAGHSLKLAWAGGINNANVSACDVNFDGVKDLVVFDRMNQFNTGRFRCFTATGQPGNTNYTHYPDLTYYFPASYNWAALVDYNGDGKEDLFTSVAGGVRVYRNTSTPANVLNFTLAKGLLYSNYNPGGQPSFTNLYVSSIGKPAISDVDGDGSPDILTFAPLGTFVEAHRHVGPADSLNYELLNGCWGNISESSCDVSFNACSGSRAAGPAHVLHAGSCMTCIDSDNDGDQDLLMGDISCNMIQYVHNTGSTALAHLSDSTKLYPNFPNKGSTTPIRINNFPCAYNVDVDHDGKTDLVASPNVFGSENYRSMWYYRNASATPTVDFQFVKKTLLQDEMIEVGQNAFPALFDYDGDGKKDLLIGTYGYYETNALKCVLTLYRNTGTFSQPSFSLITRDYAGLAAQGLNHVMPAVGDVDGDGDTDILVGTSTGQIHWLENTAGSGNPPTFTFHLNPFGFYTPSAESAPQLFDFDNDGRMDIMTGMKNGQIAWYRNISSGGTPSFTLQSSAVGNIDVKGSSGIYGLDGYAVPFFYRENNKIRVLVGSVNGDTRLYEEGVAGQPFSMITSRVNNYNEGDQSAPWYEDINGDGKRDLFLGNASGGLAFFSSGSPNVDVPEYIDPASITLWPNPARETADITINGFTGAVEATLCDVTGNALREMNVNKHPSVSLGGIPPGIYVVILKSRTGAVIGCKKLIVE